jgi:transcriptional regulator with XRE-family HTH domain
MGSTFMIRLNLIVGNNIRMLRRNRGLSQEEFAERCGLHRTYVGAIERGERNITLETLEKFARALNVRPETLLMRNEKAEKGRTSKIN